MVLSDLSIRRPVLATVMSLAIIVLGVISFLRLSVREYLKIDTPVVSVRTVYKGASPQVMESQITQPLEDSISGIEGVRSIKSVSREEVSQITVAFVLERNVDAASNDVRDRVSRVRALLPAAADDSVVSKIEADAQAILWMRLSTRTSSAAPCGISRSLSAPRPPTWWSTRRGRPPTGSPGAPGVGTPAPQRGPVVTGSSNGVRFRMK